MIADYVTQRRWFRGKARPLREMHVEEAFPIDLAGAPASLMIVRATYAEGDDDRYVLLGWNDATTHHDALAEPRLLSALLEKLRGGGTRITGERGTLVFRPLPGFDAVKATSLVPKPSETEQTNTSVPFGDGYILKIVRKLDEGRSAELEMGELLTKSGYAGTPPLLGAIEIERPNAKEPSTVGIVHRFVPNRGDAWTFTLDLLARSNAAADYAPYASRLGKRIAEMHAALARATGPSFAPEPLDRARRQALADGVRAGVRGVQKWLAEGDAARIDRRLAMFVELEHDPVATRVHGDLHLGQILVTDAEDFVIIDFEGEPARPLAERKAKRSPMADVAGMLRSFDYAAATAKAPRAWYEGAARELLAAYGEAPREVLDFHLLEKCIYEIGYEANNRPDWIEIPRAGLRELLA